MDGKQGREKNGVSYCSLRRPYPMWLCVSECLIGKSWQRMGRCGLHLQNIQIDVGVLLDRSEEGKDGPNKREGSSTNDVDARESSGVSER